MVLGKKGLGSEWLAEPEKKKKKLKGSGFPT
jgi:hypothetical protein